MKKSLVAIAVLVMSGATFGQAYQVLTAPASFTNVAGQFMYQAAANDISFANGVRGAAGVINVGGRAVEMPAAYRFAANAPRVAATFAFANPALLLVGSAAVAYAFYKGYGYYVENGQWVKESDGKLWKVVNEPDPWHASAGAACGAYQAKYYKADAYCTFSSGVAANLSTCEISQSCIAPFNNGNGVFSRPGLTSKTIPTTKEPAVKQDFEDFFAGKPLPAGVPQALPIPLPVGTPILNPAPVPATDPLADPVARPLDIPLSEPVPVPNSNPPEWKTPTVTVAPKNDPSNPWRVTVTPKDVVTNSPDPITGEPVKDAAPAPKEEQPDLCKLHPEIVACQELGTGSADPLRKETNQVSVIPESFAEVASCPAPLNFAVMGKSYSISYQPLCNLMIYLKFIILAISAFIAAYVLADSFKVQ